MEETSKCQDNENFPSEEAQILHALRIIHDMFRGESDAHIEKSQTQERKLRFLERRVATLEQCTQQLRSENARLMARNRRLLACLRVHSGSHSPGPTPSAADSDGETCAEALPGQTGFSRACSTALTKCPSTEVIRKVSFVGPGPDRRPKNSRPRPYVIKGGNVFKLWVLPAEGTKSFRGQIG